MRLLYDLLKARTKGAKDKTPRKKRTFIHVDKHAKHDFMKHGSEQGEDDHFFSDSLFTYEHKKSKPASKTVDECHEDINDAVNGSTPWARKGNMNAFMRRRIGEKKSTKDPKKEIRKHAIYKIETDVKPENMVGVERRAHAFHKPVPSHHFVSKLEIHKHQIPKDMDENTYHKHYNKLVDDWSGGKDTSKSLIPHKIEKNKSKGG